MNKNPVVKILTMAMVLLFSLSVSSAAGFVDQRQHIRDYSCSCDHALNCTAQNFCGERIRQIISVNMQQLGRTCTML